MRSAADDVSERTPVEALRERAERFAGLALIGLVLLVAIEELA